MLAVNAYVPIVQQAKDAYPGPFDMLDFTITMPYFVWVLLAVLGWIGIGAVLGQLASSRCSDYYSEEREVCTTLLWFFLWPAYLPLFVLWWLIYWLIITPLKAMAPKQ